MSGRIVAGRQEPVPGSKRARAMELVKAYVESHHHPTGKTQSGIAAALGMPIQRVQGALADLDRFDPDFRRSIPAPKNGYKVTPGWNDQAAQGEANQGRHLSTRSETFAMRMRKNAAAEPDPSKRAMMEMAADQAEMQARHVKIVTEALDV